jgi:large subunit ribosomal protein L15
MNELSNLKPCEGSTRKKNRVGRGPGSGNGKTSGKGHGGQNSRSGGGVKVHFEGGQMPLYRRLPKHGFKNPFRTEYEVINLSDLGRFDDGATVGKEQLIEAGIAHKGNLVKLLANGELSKKLIINVDKASKAAVAKVEAAGGSVEVTRG